MCLGHDPRICRVDTVDVRVDVAPVSLDGSSDRDRARIRSATAERGDAVIRRDPLKSGHDGNLPLLQPLDQEPGVNLADTRSAVVFVGFDRNLPALPGAGIHAHVLKHDRKQAGCHLFTRRDNSIVFSGVMKRGGIAAVLHQLVGLSSHS